MSMKFIRQTDQPASGVPMRRMSIVVLSGLILFIAACAAPPESPPPPATASATVFEGARLITGDEAPPIEDSAFVVQDGTRVYLRGGEVDRAALRKQLNGG